MTKTLIAGLVLAVVSVGSFAQTAAATRQTNQENRIATQSANGNLTPAETSRLDKQEQHVSNVQSRADATGTETAAQKVHVNKVEKRTSKRIAKQSHDAQTTAPTN